MIQWLKFKLIERPYYDRHGNILASIKGRRNRYEKDEFYGGGKIYPDLLQFGVLERYEHFDNLLVRLNISEPDAIELEKKDQVLSIITTYRVKRRRKKTRFYAQNVKIYNFKDFKTKIISDKKAEELLREWDLFVESIETESGVTN